MYFTAHQSRSARSGTIGRFLVSREGGRRKKFTKFLSATISSGMLRYSGNAFVGSSGLFGSVMRLQRNARSRAVTGVLPRCVRTNASASRRRSTVVSGHGGVRTIETTSSGSGSVGKPGAIGGSGDGGITETTSGGVARSSPAGGVGGLPPPPSVGVSVGGDAIAGTVTVTVAPGIVRFPD